MSGKLGRRIVTVIMLAVGILVLPGVQPIFSQQPVITTPIVTQFVTVTQFLGRIMTVTVLQNTVTTRTNTESTIVTLIRSSTFTASYMETRNYTTTAAGVGVSQYWFGIRAFHFSIDAISAGFGVLTGLGLKYLVDSLRAIIRPDMIRRRKEVKPANGVQSRSYNSDNISSCPSCGKLIRARSKFCNKCGNSLTSPRTTSQ